MAWIDITYQLDEGNEMSEPKVIELTEDQIEFFNQQGLHDIYYPLKKSGQDVLLKAPQPKLVHLSELPDGTRIECRNYDEHGSSVSDAYVSDGSLFLYKSPYGEYINPIATGEIKLLQGELQVWQGGPCPWPRYVEVEALYRYGNAVGQFDAAKLDWEHSGKFQHAEIIAHRCTGRLLDGAKLVP